MSKANFQNTDDCEANSSKLLDGQYVDDMLASVEQFIEGVYRDLSLTPLHGQNFMTPNRLHTRRSFSDCSSPNGSHVGATSLSTLSSSSDESINSVSPSTRVNMDEEIERINRMCDTVEQDLRSVGVIMNNSSGDGNSSEHLLNPNTPSTPTSPSTSIIAYLNLDDSLRHTPITTAQLSNSPETHRTRSRSRQPSLISTQDVIDLSEIQTQTPHCLENNISNTNANANNSEDDDVILVSSNINPVVDLCTPGCQQQTSRRRRRKIDRVALTRRSLQIPEVQIVTTSEDVVANGRRRRIGNKNNSLDKSMKEVQNNIGHYSPPSADNCESRPIPFMCAVCMESCIQRQPTSTRCGHIFCKTCLMEAIRLTHKCPLCNAKISKNQIFRIYP